MLRGWKTDMKLVADRTVGGLPLPYADTNFRYTGSAPKARLAAKRMRIHLKLLQDMRDDLQRELAPRRAYRRVPLIGALLAGAALFDHPDQPLYRSFPGYTRNLVCPVTPVTTYILSKTNCGIAVVKKDIAPVTNRPLNFGVWGPVVAEYNSANDYRYPAERWSRPLNDPSPGHPLRFRRPYPNRDTRFHVPAPVRVGTILTDWPQDSSGSEPPRHPGLRPQRNRQVVSSSGGRVTTVVRSDIVARPPRREKERKVRAMLGGATIPGQIIAAMTEGIDMVQAFFRAMTDEQRSRFWSEQAARNRAAKKECVRRNKTRKAVAACYAALPQTATIRDKTAFIARHFDTMDMGAVINEIAIMNAEDGWWGRLGKLEAGAALRRGQLTGGDFGARDMEPVNDDRTVVSGGQQIALREWLRRKYGE